MAAANAGADYLGMVFATSKRQMDPAKAKEIADCIRDLRTRPLLVGVFVDLNPADINEIADYCRLDLVQLSGKESWYRCGQIKLPIIKALHITPASTAEEICQEIEKGYRWISQKRLTVLLDTQSSEGGGSGKTFDWRIAKEAAARFPVIVAGGLDPENVAKMIGEVKPWGVDVSSGVETLGKKDIKKIEEFVRTAKASAPLPNDLIG
jgi:phosphoribosylanthranilate isomerase